MLCQYFFSSERTGLARFNFSLYFHAFFGLGLYKTNRWFLKYTIHAENDFWAIVGTHSRKVQGNDNQWYNLVAVPVTEQSRHLFKFQCKDGYFSLHCPACLAHIERDKQIFFARKWTAERLLLIASWPLLFVLRDGKPPLSHFLQWTPWSMKTYGRESTEICAKASSLFLKNIYCCSMKRQLHNPSPQRL